jgi:hypothetical protein
MKLALFAALLLPLSVWGRESAYEALRAVGAERSKELLNNVIEVKGRNGSPQPVVWTVLLNDPKARGGVREIEVTKGHIASERTPVKTYNLDSQGAFAVAEAEARAAKVGFFGVDYLLRCEENGSAPVWVLQLLDPQQHSIGSVTVAADTGTVIAKTFGGQTTKGSWAAGGGMKGRLERFSGSVGRSLRHVGGSLEEFWNGERTLDKPDNTGDLKKSSGD